jgi:hypothetical protein
MIVEIDTKIPDKPQNSTIKNFFTFSLFHFSTKHSFAPLNSAFFILIILLFFLPAYAQDLPDEIRGYKVYQKNLKIKSDENQKDEDFDLEVKFGEPKLVDVGIFGVTFELFGEITSFKQSGKIDFLTFNDFRVNDIKVSIEEYQDSFELKKNKPVKLKKPVKIFVSFPQGAIGIVKDWRESKEKWLVTGRIFVFGKFKKFGLKFKRAIPVEINLNIKNPLN